MFDPIKLGLLVTCALYAVGDAVPESIPGLVPSLQFGALGVLAWTVWVQQSELRELRKKHGEVIDKLCDRWNAWETILHGDSEKLDGTLRMMTANCAAVQAQLKRGE